MDVKWEDPPVTHSRGGTVSAHEAELAEILKQNPDNWARLADFENDKNGRAGNLAGLIRAGKRAAFRADSRVDGGEFEAVSRRVPGTKITAVYVRFATLNND